MQSSIVAGAGVRVASSSDVDESFACSVVAAIRHMVVPVCTWKKADVDDMRVEGRKLMTYLGKASQETDAKVTFCTVSEQNGFCRNWSVDIGVPDNRDFGSLEEQFAMYEDMHEHLIRDGMCLLNLHDAVSAIIHHQDCLVLVDCGTCDASGLVSHVGTSVVVFNTS